MINHRTILFLFLLMVTGLFTACTSSEAVKVINNTSYTFCKVKQTPNLSVYAPWQKKISRIKLHPGETISLSGGDENHILYLFTCDDRYVVSNYNHRPNPGEPWVLTDDIVSDIEEAPNPTPIPTRTPVNLTIANGTGKDVCSIQFSRRREPLQFSENILTQTMSLGDEIVLHEPKDIEWGTFVIKISFCDGSDYVTEAVVFENVMTIILRGEVFDTHDLRIERQGEVQ